MRSSTDELGVLYQISGESQEKLATNEHKCTQFLPQNTQRAWILSGEVVTITHYEVLSESDLDKISDTFTPFPQSSFNGMGWFRMFIP